MQLKIHCGVAHGHAAHDCRAGFGCEREGVSAGKRTRSPVQVACMKQVAAEHGVHGDLEGGKAGKEATTPPMVSAMSDGLERPSVSLLAIAVVKRRNDITHAAKTIENDGKDANLRIKCTSKTVKLLKANPQN
eukprot:446431-Amphidinium_carterae.1